MTQIYYLTLPLADKSLPSICQRSNCLLDVIKGTKYCQKHQPKPKKDTIKPTWFNKYVIYMIRIEGEPYIKIGVAKDFSSRLSSLQVGNPRKIEVIAVLHAGSSSESLLHRELQDHSVRGEWFLEAPVLHLLDRLLVNRKFRERFNLGEVLALSDKIAYSSSNNG